ncbi:hypothetical protein N9235_02170, partial [Gammaproteobacteria bacterium]|nr:hypothetical protein [Gammaproteobacteria bacterium]
MKNSNWGGVLAEPFPWLVTQGVILVLVIVKNQLYVVGLGMPTEITTLESWWVRLQLALIFASLVFKKTSWYWLLDGLD